MKKKPLHLFVWTLLALGMVLAFAACNNNIQPSSSGEEEQPVPDGTPVELNDGVYLGYQIQPKYTIQSQVTVEGGAVTDVVLEEAHNPAYWATLTDDEAAALSPDIVKLVEGSSRNANFYAVYLKIGEGDEALLWTAAEETLEDPSDGWIEVRYEYDGLTYEAWAQDDNNATWYFEQLAAGNYWISDAEGNPADAELATYTTQLKDGTQIDKTGSRFKTIVRHWTAVGTGVGTESGSLGWQGNMYAIESFLMENAFMSGAYTHNEEGYILVADVNTGATVESYADYFSACYKAYAKAQVTAAGLM